MFTFNGRVISWKSAKHTRIACSSLEAKFITFELAGQEEEWWKSQLAYIPLWGRQPTTISLHCDSYAAIGVAHDSVYNEKNRHIRIFAWVHTDNQSVSM